MWQQVSAVSPDPISLYQYGLAGIVILALSAAVLTLWRENLRLNAAALAREREMGDKTIPVLAESVRVLASVPPALDRALSQAESATRAGELRQTISEVLREQRPG